MAEEAVTDVKGIEGAGKAVEKMLKNMTLKQKLIQSEPRKILQKLLKPTFMEPLMMKMLKKVTNLDICS